MNFPLKHIPERTSGIRDFGLTMMMDKGMDTGDILLMKKTAIGPEETASDLHDRLSDMGATTQLDRRSGFEHADVVAVLVAEERDRAERLGLGLAGLERPRPLVAERLGVDARYLVPYGNEIAKVHIDALGQDLPGKKPGKLILVSATTPTRAGEGKTTTSIGLGQALTHLGESVCVALREPSLGPCLGVKGGATGGGYAQVVPANRINLHFTGDFHAITTANNLVSAALDNHIYWGNELGIDPRMVAWRRVMDMNDRSLRHIVLGLGGRFQGRREQSPPQPGPEVRIEAALEAGIFYAT